MNSGERKRERKLGGAEKVIERGGCFEVAATVWWWWWWSSLTTELLILPLALFYFILFFVLGFFWLFAFAEREKDEALHLLLDQI